MTRSRFVAAATPDVALVTVPGVELLEVGEDWATSTGLFTFTEDDLASAIASQDDPGVRTPVIKLGHTDPRFDGQPTFGRIQNMYLSENGQTLIGDFVGVPAWLGQVMSSAYPRRSIEGWFDAPTRTGNEWPFILTGIALLGEAYPAVNTLEDLALLWGEEPPELVPADDAPAVVASVGELIRATRKEDVVPKWRKDKDDAAATPAASDPATVETDDQATEEQDMPRQVRAAVSVEDIRRNYYETLGSAQMWWWIREVRVDPAELIVDDDEGGLLRVPYFISTDGTVTYGEAVEVEVEYVDVAATAPAVPVADGQQVAASWADPVKAGRPDRTDAGNPPRPTATSGTVTDDEEEAGMFTDEQRASLRTRFGLADDADDQAILSAMTEATLTAAPESTDGDGTDTDPPAGTPDEGGDGEDEDPDPTDGDEPTGGAVGGDGAAALPDGMVVIDEATLQELRDGATAANQLVTAAAERDRDEFLDEAIRAGKFPKARRGHYEALLSADPEGTRALISNLAPGLVPLAERGHGNGVDASAPDANAYPASWKGSVQAARRGASGRVKVVGD